MALGQNPKMKPTDSGQVGSSAFRKSAIASVLLVAILSCAHPVSCDDLWWELSKGRAVAGGSLTPSADLVAAAIRSDANWLSGLPIYFAFVSLGMSGLMCLKVGAALAITGRLLRQSGRFDLLTGTVIATAILSARQAWEPSPLLFDTIGVMVVAMASEYWSKKPSFGRLIPLLLLMSMWANLGSRSIVGIAVALNAVLRAPAKLVIRTIGIAMLIVTCCLTPAGPMTLRDSLMITIPQAAENFSFLHIAGSHPWWERMGQAEASAFALFCLVVLFHAARGRSSYPAAIFIAGQFLGAASSENLPLAAVWMAAVATSQIDRSAAPVARGAVAIFLRIQGILSAAVLGFACIAAANPWNGCGSAFGWGLDPRIQPEAFAASINGATLTESAHCVGLREAGLLSWHIREGVKPFDTPVTALLNGRLRDHVLLTTDLSKGWQIPHRRPDGSWGGWWSISRQRRTTALVVPSEDMKLINALEPSIWKPLSLNAVSIVYGRAGDAGCAQKIVDNLYLRQFVDRGTWTYQISSEESSSHVDVMSHLIGTPPAYDSLRLARVFRAMNMHFAALKILTVFPRDTHEQLQQEFNANQLALGYEERVHNGRSSRWRLNAWRLTARSDQLEETRQDVLNWSTAETLQGNDLITEAVRFYVDGDSKTALDKLAGNLPEVIYARAMLLVESGQVENAKSLLDQLVTNFSDHQLSATAKMIAASLVF